MSETVRASQLEEIERPTGPVVLGDLHGLWRRQNPALRPVLIATAVLIALGILGTFPTFFQAFAPE